MQRFQANMTLFYKANTIAGLLLHVHFVILNHHNCAATQVYLTNTCKNELTTFVKKNVCGSFVLWLPLQEVYKYEIHASSFHIFSGTTKRFN